MKRQGFFTGNIYEGDYPVENIKECCQLITDEECTEEKNELRHMKHSINCAGCVGCATSRGESQEKQFLEDLRMEQQEQM